MNLTPVNIHMHQILLENLVTPIHDPQIERKTFHFERKKKSAFHGISIHWIKSSHCSTFNMYHVL